MNCCCAVIESVNYIRRGGEEVPGGIIPLLPRLPHQHTRTTPNYIVLSSGAVRGRAGMELWLSTKLPYAVMRAEDENSLELPLKVAPVNGTIHNAGRSFRHTLPANSLTVLRLKAE